MKRVGTSAENAFVRVCTTQYTVGVGDGDGLGLVLVARCRSLLIYSMPRGQQQRCAVHGTLTFTERPRRETRSADGRSRSAGFCKTNCATTSRLARANYKIIESERKVFWHHAPSCAFVFATVSGQMPAEEDAH